METILTVLIVVIGFSYVTYVHSQHVAKLEVLLKAKDLREAKSYEVVQQAEYVGKPEPESLSDVIADKEPDQIREIFKQ